MDYHAVLAAEHVSRYMFAASLCTGKRVLDVACGEGYGASILAGQGASEVVGVDISNEAIAVARRRFARDGVEFVCGDALQLPGLLGESAPFDVIVSFETIEHVSDPVGFLERVRRMLAPAGVVLISCPNDGPEAERGISNPYHVRTYTLAEFQELTTAVLGPAARWYLGTPLQGTVIAEAASPALHNQSHDLGLLVDAREAVSGHMLPAQANISVSPANCGFYLGAWGASGDAVQVAAPMSRKAYLDPWITAEWFKNERKRDAEALQRAEEHVAFLEEQIGELRRAWMIDKARFRAGLLRNQEDAWQRLHALEASRGYRLLQRYYALAGSSAIGPVIQCARSVAGRALRLPLLRRFGVR